MISQFLVEFMRHLAVGYIIASSLDPKNNLDPEARYLNSQNYRAMTQGAEYGDQHEIVALARAPSLPIKVEHLENIGKNQQGDWENFGAKSNDPLALTISLLYRTKPLHYDLLVNAPKA